MLDKPLFWAYCLGLFQVYIFLNNRFTFHPPPRFKEMVWTFSWIPGFFLLLALPSWGLALSWDFTPSGWIDLPLGWKAWTLSLVFLTLWLWAVHSHWLVVLRRPLAHRLVASREAVMSSSFKAPFPFLKYLGFENQIYQPQVNEYEVRIPGWPREFDGFSLVQLTDLHHGRYMHREYLEAVLKEARKLKADLFVLTGDLIFLKKDIEGLKGLFKGYRGTQGAFAVMGNHDYWADGDGVRKLLKGEGIRVLKNEAVLFRRKGKSLALIGTDDLWMGRSDEEAVLKVKADAKILLAHHPDQFPLAKKAGIHLQVSGHCHGGQICLPWIGPLIVPSARGRKHAGGFLREGDSTLFISRGIGGFPPIRTHCPPEIVKLVLRPG